MPHRRQAGARRDEFEADREVVSEGSGCILWLHPHHRCSSLHGSDDSEQPAGEHALSTLALRQLPLPAIALAKKNLECQNRTKDQVNSEFNRIARISTVPVPYFRVFWKKKMFRFEPSAPIAQPPYPPRALRHGRCGRRRCGVQRAFGRHHRAARAVRKLVPSRARAMRAAWPSGTYLFLSQGRVTCATCATEPRRTQRAGRARSLRSSRAAPRRSSHAVDAPP